MNAQTVQSLGVWPQGAFLSHTHGIFPVLGHLRIPQVLEWRAQVQPPGYMHDDDVEDAITPKN